MAEKTNKKAWYTTWWGTVILIIFLPFTVFTFAPYFLYEVIKNKDNKTVNYNYQRNFLIGLGIFILILISSSFDSNGKLETMNQLINEGKYEQAKLEGKIYQDSSDFKDIYAQLALMEDEKIKERLLNMSEEDLALLEKQELQITESSYESINNTIEEKLHILYPELESIKEQIALEEAIQAEIERQEKIQSLFSGWDGSNRALVDIVKQSLHDPGSFDHVATSYEEIDDQNIRVRMQYRASNLFGVPVLNAAEGIIHIDTGILTDAKQL